MEVKLVAITTPKVEGIETAEDFIAYCARVSNPANQLNTGTKDKLLKYLVKNKHWSPFEMVTICLEIKTTRDIGRQILRHRSFSFQEFSQRYAEVVNLWTREPRYQDPKNRQNSIGLDPEDEKTDALRYIWFGKVMEAHEFAFEKYKWALDQGIAKEVARAFLPEGFAETHMYMSGTLRSWIHYCDLRMGNGTQKEHQEIAKECWDIICKEIPALEHIFLSDAPYVSNTPRFDINGKRIKTIEEFKEEQKEGSI